MRLENKEYPIPNYLSIEQYVNIYKVKDLFSDTYLAPKLINIVLGAPLELLLKQDYQEVNYLAAYIMSLIPTDKEVKFIDRFELEGVHYGFFPNWRDLSFAEFIDMDTIATKPVNELLDMLHFLAAIMFRPIEHELSEHNFLIEEYDVESMKKRAELFKKKLDIKYILGAQVFFCKFANRFSLYTQASSIPKLTLMEKMKMMWQLRKIIWKLVFKKRTVGSLSSTELLETMLQNMKPSSKKISRKL